MPQIFAAGLLATNLTAADSAHATATLAWAALPAIPDREGFAGSFAGVSGGALLVAGGANFPERRPWEGGAKVWYDCVFVLAPDATAWREAGKLPAPSGYGVSLTIEDGALWIGGGDARANSAAVRLARWDGRALTFDSWPALPRPLAMAAGARVDRTLYVAGGLSKPDATQAEAGVYALDLADRAAGWRQIAPCPGGPRFLATAAAHNGAFYLFSGARLVTGADGKSKREWLRDAWRYTPGEGWQRLADLPHPVVAAPSPAPERSGRILLLGGDDGAQVDIAPTAHRGFPREVLAFDPARNAWTSADKLPFGLVTTTLVEWQGRIVVPGGEARPGVRSTEVWATK